MKDISCDEGKRLFDCYGMREQFIPSLDIIYKVVEGDRGYADYGCESQKN